MFALQQPIEACIFRLEYPQGVLTGLERKVIGATDEIHEDEIS